jgi:hypothetical protein
MDDVFVIGDGPDIEASLQDEIRSSEMAKRFKKNTIVAYRINDSYCHPECADEWPGQGEAIFASDVTLESDGNLYFPGEYHNDITDRDIDTTCCIGCGQWFNDDNRFEGIEIVVNKVKVS